MNYNVPAVKLPKLLVFLEVFIVLRWAVNKMGKYPNFIAIQSKWQRKVSVFAWDLPLQSKPVERKSISETNWSHFFETNATGSQIVECHPGSVLTSSLSFEICRTGFGQDP